MSHRHVSDRHAPYGGVHLISMYLIDVYLTDIYLINGCNISAPSMFDGSVECANQVTSRSYTVENTFVLSNCETNFWNGPLAWWPCVRVVMRST